MATTPNRTATPPRFRGEAFSETTIVRRYLGSLPKKVVSETRKTRVRDRLAVIAEELGTDDVIARLHLWQERRDLLRKMSSWGADESPGLEEEFTKVAKSFSDRKGIDWSTWREAGVKASVLRRAGVLPTQKT